MAPVSIFSYCLQSACASQDPSELPNSCGLASAMEEIVQPIFKMGELAIKAIPRAHHDGPKIACLAAQMHWDPFSAMAFLLRARSGALMTPRPPLFGHNYTRFIRSRGSSSVIRIKKFATYRGPDPSGMRAASIPAIASSLKAVGVDQSANIHLPGWFRRSASSGVPERKETPFVFTIVEFRGKSILSRKPHQSKSGSAPPP